MFGSPQTIHTTREDFVKAPMPAIVFVHDNHFAVVDSITENNEVVMRDPALGKLKLPVRKPPRIWNGKTLVFIEEKRKDEIMAT